MRKPAWLWGCTVAVPLVLWGAFGAPTETNVARAEVPSVPSAPDLVVVAGVPQARSSDVYRLAGSPGATPQRIGTIEHEPGAVVRGRLLPGSDKVLVIADVRPDREVSWAASLLLVAPGAPTEHLCDRVYHATRPLVTASGRVFVQRGRAGREPVAVEGKAQMRVDELTIDEVDPATGQARTVHSGAGFGAQLAGERAGELIL